MGKYTKTIKEIVEQYGTGSTLNQKIVSALPYIFDFEFPLFDESYRTVLETKIIKHYFTREICEEDEELWKLRLDTKLNEIMPYYNQLYESLTLEINPLYTHQLKTDRTSGSTDTTQQETTGTKNSSTTDNGTVITNVADEHNNSTATNTQTVASSNHNTTDSSSTNETRNSNGTSEAKTDEKNVTTNTESGTSTTTVRENDTPNGSFKSLTDGYLTKATQETGKTSGESNSKVDHDVTVTTENENEETVNSNTSHTISGTENSDNTTIQTGQDNYNAETKTETTDQRISSLTDTTTSRSTGSVLTTENYLENVVGYSGVSQSKLLMEYRETFLNIDKEIVESLNDLFILLW
jgi:hypothetical protein